MDAKNNPTSQDSYKNDIPEMSNANSKYSNSQSPHAPLVPEITEKQKKEMEEKRKKLEKLQKFIVKKYPFTEAIGILPPQAVRLLIEEENIDLNFPKEVEKIEKNIHLFIIIPEEKLKETPKIKAEIVKEIDKEKLQVWLHVKTPVDVWEYGLDSKFDVVGAIAMCFPLYDKGLLGALRVAEIHKSLVLRKFEKYVVSYVLGVSLVRGTATKTSDVDIFIIINDTDVKRMSRVELRERLRSMIYQYVGQASELAVVKNKLSPQIYLLTDFWESVKDAHPVMFTFIRDGIPIYDRGTFMPWKALLKMGKLKPSPEAIDMFISMGEKTQEQVNRRLIDAMIDIYYGVLTPSQALLMLYGLPPPTPKETAVKFKEIFLDKEKMIEKKYISTLEKAVQLFKDYEHEKLKTIKGDEIDQLLKDSEEFLKRLGELRKQIEKRTQEKTVEQIYEDTFKLLKSIIGNKSQAELISEFEKNYVKQGKFAPQSLQILHDIVSAREEFKKGKLSGHKVEDARKNGSILINSLIEYTQRCELAAFDKKRMLIKYRDSAKNPKVAELLATQSGIFLIKENQILKSDSQFFKFENAKNEDLMKATAPENNQTTKQLEINPKIFELLKRELGEFEILL